jgi:hypothetical protein
VVINDIIQGILALLEVMSTLCQERMPRFESAPLCRSSASLNEMQMLLIGSPTGRVIMRKRGEFSLAGILILHELLRVQPSATDAPADA